MTVPFIQTEIAAPHARSLMAGIEFTFLIAGYMLSCWVDYGFKFLLPRNVSWQGPFIIQIIRSFILVAMSFFLPETPIGSRRTAFRGNACRLLRISIRTATLKQNTSNKSSLKSKRRSDMRSLWVQLAGL